MKEDNLVDRETPRTAAEIAKRAIALHCVIAASHGVSKSDICEWLKSENIYDELSPWERGFIEAEQNTRRDIIQASWRVEAQVALLWSIQKIDHLDALSAQCNSTPLVDAMPELFSPTSVFIESAKLRGDQEIGEEYERIYDAHCEVRGAARTGASAGYESGVVQERHYAMNWITGYCGQAWDDVTTDT
ncbi:MAG: DUF4272 domain-containing protein [Terricaulis sp.]